MSDILTNKKITDVEIVEPYLARKAEREAYKESRKKARPKITEAIIRAFCAFYPTWETDFRGPHHFANQLGIDKARLKEMISAMHTRIALYLASKED